MSDILLDSLKRDIAPELKDFLKDDIEGEKTAKAFLNELLINYDLLSTESYTTVSETNSKGKTLMEEIAELDQQQRSIDIKLAGITNNNTDLIIDINDDLASLKKELQETYRNSVDSMLKLSDFESHSTKLEISSNEKSRRSIRINASILSNMDSVLDLLELPTLCKLCILQGNYQESLEISMLVKTLVIRFPKVAVFQKISKQIQLELKLMTKGLVRLLNKNLSQKNILKIFQILNKLDLNSFSEESDESEQAKQIQKDKFLKIIYLNARFKFIMNELANLEPLIKYNKLTYLKRLIEIYREYIFSSLSIYYAIFNPVSKLLNERREGEDSILIGQFVKSLVSILSQNLIKFLPEILHPGDSDEINGVDEMDDVDRQGQKDGLILQIMYLCNSLAKFNVDFECAIVLEIYYKHKLISEDDWLRNLAKVKNFKS
ncbi:uncharacterized protein PRCAT00002738001 [Priceomyces carsonii]|uniref:uncharacterized protein n=1 Tax=Priceomyces carsonii TaxID=28549 RepID=UPI002ED9EC03|nr:unnamed protein product [Priceomyces carsonii]